MIEVKNLRKSFKGLEVLRGINETIAKGEKVVVVGPSGSGKSTFLRCLNRLEEPSGGEIWFEGINICDPKCNINRLRQKMGMVFQQFNLFAHLSVKENITLAPTKLKIMTPAEADEKAMQLLNRIGLAEKANAYPSQLSGGQQQRIAIVRALAMDSTGRRVLREMRDLETIPVINAGQTPEDKDYFALELRAAGLYGLFGEGAVWAPPSRLRDERIYVRRSAE